MSDDKTLYYVQEGQMMSGWKVASIDFRVNSPDDAGHGDIIRLVTGTDEKLGQLPNESTERRIYEMIEREGQWNLMSGMRIVHGDDLYSTREAAAEAYKKFLMGDE